MKSLWDKFSQNLSKKNSFYRILNKFNKNLMV
jgi:hypothetical protein